MSSLQEIRNERLKKRARLAAAGMDPYPARTKRTHALSAVVQDFESLARKKETLTLTGRVMVVRGQGAILFVDIREAANTFQVVLKEDELGSEALGLFSDTVDAGDFIEVTGELFVTQKGQESLLASGWRMLTKSLLPLPDKYHGLQNEEERLRKRYLDILLNAELQETFKRKEKFWDVTRSFLKEHAFMEVATPTLERTTGGAEARPFQTHHNDFDIDVFLRISIGELWQKRLMAAGFERTFEIGRAYRNEGTSPEHLQEFTNMEFYAAYQDYRFGMTIVQDLYRTLAHEVYGKTEFTYKDHTFNLADEWPEIEYVSEIEKQTGVNVTTATQEEMQAKLGELGVSYDGQNRERLTDTLWKYCRKQISGPAFLVGHPKLIAPLSKSKEDIPDVTEKFQVLIAGSEVGTGYSELNDPLDQRERFEVQKALLAEGDDEAMMSDDEFVEMLEHGMPPTCGFGFGERLFTIFENKPLREVQLFPLVRSKED